MGEDEAFLTAIRARPADDTARLVYADWLEERGDARSDFLRLEYRVHGGSESEPEHLAMQQQLNELGQPLERRWIAAVCRVPVEFNETAMSSTTWTDPLSTVTATAGGVTATGNYRETNQDSLVLDRHHPIAVVIDGMGSNPEGRQAAVVAGDAICRAIAAGLATDESPESYLRRAVQEAHAAIAPLSDDRNRRHAAATAVFAVLRAGRVFVSWVGDSMAYRVSRDTIVPLTWQHDFGTLICRQNGASEEEARDWRGGKNLLYCLGGGLPDPIEVHSFAPKPGDRLVLATDGVHRLMERAEFAAVSRLHADVLASAEHLVQHALDLGPRDNTTCVVIDFDGPPERVSDPILGRID